MDRMIFINLPIRDLAASRRFYEGVGFRINEAFSDTHCLCVVISPTIFVMALDHERFADFVTTPIADPRRATQVLNCLSAATAQEVEDFVAAAEASGGQRYEHPNFVATEGPQGEQMHGAAVTDPDGHVWEVLYMSAT